MKKQKSIKKIAKYIKNLQKYINFKVKKEGKMDYREMVTFRRLKETIEEKRLKVSEVAERIGVAPSEVSGVITGARLPKTDFLARICWAVGEDVASVCEFKGIEPTEYQREWFGRIGKVYAPAADAKGDVTYRPLRRVLDAYLEERNKEF